MSELLETSMLLLKRLIVARKSELLCQGPEAERLLRPATFFHSSFAGCGVDNGVRCEARILLAALVLFFALLPCFATTSIISVEPTQMQAKVSIRTDQAGKCTYRASRGTVFSSNVPDLVDNGSTDERPGSIVNGTSHVFVLGTRKGSDALAAAATYWIGVSCGSDGEVSTTFTTLPVPLGNLAPDPVPFNGARFGNMDYPVIDWNDQTKSYVDPVEGLEFWRLSGPGIVDASSFTAQFNQTALVPIDLAGAGTWMNIVNAVTNGKTFTTAKGGVSDKLFIPLAPHSFYDGASGWISKHNADDILVNVYCGNAERGGITLTLQFTLDGGQTAVGTPVTTSSCPQTRPVKIGTYPGPVPLPLFRGWGMNAPQHNLVIPPSGRVSVANRVAILQTQGASNNYFVTDWVPGTPIQIDRVYYHVNSVQSPTKLTIAEDPGILTNAPYSGANSGIVVAKNGSGSVDVSFGLDIFGSGVADNGVNGDTLMVNPIPVTVTRAADGRTLLTPPLIGYLAFLVDQWGAGSIILWIPYNGDGSIRNEVRLLSADKKPSASPRMHAAGDRFQYDVGLLIRSGTVFDGVDGKSWFAMDADGVHFFRMTYDETLQGCTGFPSYNPYPVSGGYPRDASVADDCFQWHNLTPSSANPPMDLLSQMKRAYRTGVNSLGEAVGAPHPNFDLGWFGHPSSGLTDGGYITATIANRGEHLCIFAAFDSKTGVIKVIKNMWGGDGDTEARWGGIHSAGAGAGTWRFAAMNGLDDNTGVPGQEVFNSAFDLPIVKVNRAGYTRPARWDTNTSLTGKEAYICPSSVPLRYVNLSGTPNCIEVKVSTPPCNATPNSSYIFPDGKTEKEEFPCTTPGFGIADSNRSKLMEIQPGDWLRERRSGPLNEEFVALTVTYNGTNDIDIWLLRWARHNYLLPLLDNGDDYQPVYDARSNGWFLSMAPSFNVGPSSIAIDLSAGGSAKWLPDNGQRAGCHGTFGPGTSPGLYIYAEPCDPPTYRGNFDMPLSAMIFQPFLPMGVGYPGFGGSADGIARSFVQNYNNNTWWFGAANPPFQLDFRHLNPSYGAGPEILNSVIGSPRKLTLVPGTSKSYLIGDTLSAGPSNYKRLPLYGYAGHYLLKDTSGPATANMTDLPDYSVCRALNAGECFDGSAPGNLYVTVPKAYIDDYCRTDQFTLPDPCAFQLAPFAGQVLQFRTDKADAAGFTVRKLGYVHGMPGLQYQFSNCRATPDAAFAFCVADWLDGVRSEWVALRLNPFPNPDGVDRTTFVPISFTYQGSSTASYIRARFGYLENGATLLRCMPYQAECSTEIPKRATKDPYSFTNEMAMRQSCPNGSVCKITIPAISNRMLYYVVDRLDYNGNLVTSDPLQVVAVP